MFFFIGFILFLTRREHMLNTIDSINNGNMRHVLHTKHSHLFKVFFVSLCLDTNSQYMLIVWLMRSQHHWNWTKREKTTRTLDKVHRELEKMHDTSIDIRIFGQSGRVCECVRTAYVPSNMSKHENWECK